MLNWNILLFLFSIFHPLEIVGRGSESQFQVGEKFGSIIHPFYWQSTILLLFFVLWYKRQLVLLSHRLPYANKLNGKCLSAFH